MSNRKHTPESSRNPNSSIRYQTSGEVAGERVGSLQSRERCADTVLASLKSKLTRAAAQAMRGEVVDGEDFFKKLFDRLES